MAMPQSRDELNSIIQQQVRLAIGGPQIENVGKVGDYFAKFDELATSFVFVSFAFVGFVSLSCAFLSFSEI